MIDKGWAGLSTRARNALCNHYRAEHGVKAPDPMQIASYFYFNSNAYLLKKVLHFGVTSLGNTRIWAERLVTSQP